MLASVGSSVESLVASLCKQHPRLIVLIGEDHFSLQSKKLERTLLQNADVGFFEMSSELMGQGKDHITHQEAQYCFAHIPPGHPYYPSVQLLQTPRAVVYADITRTAHEPFNLAKNAYLKLLEDEVPETHTVRQSVHDIYESRAIDRVKLSNGYMAQKIGDYLDKYFPNDQPFSAVAIVGNNHINWPKEKEYLKDSALPDLLKARGFKVMTLQLEPVARNGAREHEGDTALVRQDMENMDFTAQITDSACAAEQRYL